MYPGRLKDTREGRELSQQDLADRTGISLRQIVRYESGESSPNADALMRLAQELEVSADYLLGLTDDPKGHIQEDDLSPIERKLLAAWRRDDLRKLLELVMTITEKKEE